MTSAKIKVKNLPPAPEPTKAYHTPPPMHGYDNSLAFFKTKDYDAVKEGMYGLTSSDEDEMPVARPDKKEDKTVDRRKTAYKQLPYDIDEFAQYLAGHTRRQTSEHFGITMAQVDSRMDAMRRRKMEIVYVKERYIGDVSSFWDDCKTMKPAELAKKHHLSLDTVYSRLQRAKTRENT